MTNLDGGSVYTEHAVCATRWAVSTKSVGSGGTEYPSSIERIRGYGKCPMDRRPRRPHANTSRLSRRPHANTQRFRISECECDGAEVVKLTQEPVGSITTQPRKGA